MNPGSDRRSLDVHFAGGVAWTAGAKWITQVLSWGTVFLAARLLSKEDFGIAEMASYFYLLAGMLAESGIGIAVLQMQELEPYIIAQLHTFAVISCTLAYIVSLAFAPLIASFFRVEHLTSLIMVNNLAFLISGFHSVPEGLLLRDMDYRRLSMIDAAQITVQSLVTLVAAWWGLGYWSLILGPGCAKLMRAAVVFSLKPIPFTKPNLRELRAPLRLGWHTAVGRLAWACYTQSDGMIVGRVLGAPVLGVYRMAMNLASAPAEKISTLIMRSAAPLFAKVQKDLTLVRRYCLILAELLTMIELPLMLGLGMVASDAVQFLLGPTWIASVVPLRWLVLFMTMRTLGTLMEQISISQRATSFTMRMSLLNLFVMPVAFFITAAWKGTGAVAASWLILAPITIFPVIWKGLRMARTTLLEFASALLPSLSGTAVMIGILFLVQSWLVHKNWPVAARLGIQVAAGGASYGAFLWLFFRRRVMRYLRFLRDFRQGKELAVEVNVEAVD